MDLYLEVANLPSNEDSHVVGISSMVDSDWVKWREIKATFESGSDVTLWALRAPAQFFRLTTDNIEIKTGSGNGMAELILKLAQEIAGGMVVFAVTQPMKENG